MYVFLQYFCGKLEANRYCPISIPSIYGCKESDPQICLFRQNNFFFDLIIEVVTYSLLSHWEVVARSTFFLVVDPFEKTVILPWLFLPALFLIKNLKNFFKIPNLSKKIVFLNRWELFNGLKLLINICINKHCCYTK